MEEKEMIYQLLMLMMEYDRGDARRIQHFIKVHAFAKMIGEYENLKPKQMFILESAAILHDCGMHLCEEKYGSTEGHIQEKEGAEVARQLLNRLDYDKDEIERICYLVGHHHTYTEVDGADHQILIEADFLVNLYEDKSSEKVVKLAYEKIFKTPKGKQLCEIIFGI